MHESPVLHTLVINSLEEQIAVIDQTGAIIDVNSAWTSFGVENGLSSKYSCVGSNYLDALSASAASGDSLAGEALQGILDVLNRKHDSFYIEYPCHSPNEKRWFIMRVTRLNDDSRSLFVLSHHNITLRKLAEERAEHLAMHDPLTGLGNRRHFDQFLEREMRRSIRNRSAISLIAVDVDNFKDYNDKLGHPAGDQCLTNVGQALLSVARKPCDLAVRLGGDEFALLLGETDLSGAQKVAEMILKAINDLRMVFSESRQVTVSMGVASMTSPEYQNGEFLIKEADKALYSAKISGRNRIALAKPIANKQA